MEAARGTNSVFARLKPDRRKVSKDQDYAIAYLAHEHDKVLGLGFVLQLLAPFRVG